MSHRLLLYMIIYSFLGWCIESIYKTIIEKKLTNSGFLYGPYCPIYGFGALIMILVFSQVPNNVFIVFIISVFILTVWEYIVGVILEKIFKTKYWDYSHLKFNIKGRVCLKNSIYWGILGVIFVFIVHPIIESEVALIPDKVLIYIEVIVYLLFITDIVTSITKILFIDKKIQQLHEIGERIKEKINELSQNDKTGKGTNENTLNVIADLKHQQAILKIKIYKLVIRLKRAFPTMQSETISKFINQKIDLKSIRNKIRKNRGE